MNTTELIPSRDRRHVPPHQAAQALDATWDSHTAYDIGPHLTCNEVEALCDLLAAHGMHYFADWLRRGHVDEDDEGDMNHNTGEYGEDED